MLLLNGEEIETVIYPNNESLLRPNFDLERDENVVTLRWDSDADLFRLFVLMGHYWDQLVHSYRQNPTNPDIILDIPYMPYSRADRSENGSVFTLMHVAQLINDMSFNRVRLYEVHSDVTLRELDRSESVSVSMLLAARASEKLGLRENDYIVYPDAGALKRFGKNTLDYRIVPQGLLTGSKERDFCTGEIIGIAFNVWELANNDTEFLGRRALIVDDLCSRGGTFIGAAKELRELGFDAVHLAVTHMEKAGYNPKLSMAMDSIHHTDSITPPDTTPKYNVYPLESFL